MDLVAVLDTWRMVVTVDFLRYFLAATPFYLLFWVWRPHWLRGRRLQEDEPGRDRVLSEIAYSMSTVVIFSAIGLCILYAQQAGATRIYLDTDERGWWYFGASILSATLAHDAYFYWTHRLLHWRPLFRLAHRVHHRSTSPTPWAAYAFHPIEAVIQAGIYVLIVFVLPMHPLALTLFLIYMIVRNVVGHLGFEVWPAGFAQHPLTRWHLTVTHHDLHHRFGKGNYGLYFSLWDDWMGTNRPDYAAAFERATAGRDSAGFRPAAAAVAVLALLLGGIASAAEATDGSPEGRWSTIYSSLSRLQRFPVDALKIDLVRGSERQRAAGRYRPRHSGARGQPQSGGDRGGFATRDLADHMTSLGCDLMQGFWFAKPAGRSTFDWSAEAVPGRSPSRASPRLVPL